ncbi:hypothetical protein RM530_02365 [Algiphilus sp. W345]|uniref:Lipoprotein n=1 Tax=Banduia mediterranea TaxID=3075609 RepID=A0ABU2WED1_9GAMM|nr:hypothetical protein [Algiphilus sp. W345]MDT0496211.1 hypothetical protein [Algiphilus sp. W345]
MMNMHTWPSVPSDNSRPPSAHTPTHRLLQAGALALSAALAGCGNNPDDPTHGSTSISAPESCAPGRQFAPLLAPRAVVESGIAGGCVGCRVVDANAVVDQDLQNHATMQVGLGLAGTAFVSVFDSARVNPAGAQVGFLVAADDGAVPLTVAVGQQTTITTFLGGQEQESTRASEGSPPIALQILNVPALLPPAPNLATRYVGLVAGREFDQVRLDFGGAVNLLNSLRVYAICLSGGS